MERGQHGGQSSGRNGQGQASKHRTLYFFLLLLSSGVLLHLSNWRWLDIYYYQELVADPHVTEVLNNLKVRLADPHVSEVLNSLKLRLNDPRLERAMRALTMKLPCPPCADSVLSSTYCPKLDNRARELDCPETRCSCLPFGMTNRDYNNILQELTSLRLNGSASEGTGCPKCYCPIVDIYGNPGCPDLTCEELRVKTAAKECGPSGESDVSSMDCEELQSEIQTKQCPLPGMEDKKLDCDALQSEMQANMCPGSPGVDCPPSADCPPVAEKPCPAQQTVVPQQGTFRDNLFNGIVRGYGPHQWRYLVKEIRRKELVPVFLDYYHPTGPADAIHLKCRGNECPRFGKCATKDYQRPHGEDPDPNTPGFAKLSNSIWSCWNSDLEDRALNKSRPPLNFPANGPQDIQLLQPWAGQVMVLHNVYINEKGQVFDEKHHFDRNGCAGDMDYMHPARTVVVHYKDLLSLAFWNGADTYHALVEILPLFVSMQHVFESLPGIPIAVRHDQMFFMRDYMQPLLGVDVARMNLQPVAKGKLFFVERLILPIYQWCGRPSPVVWSHLRKNYLFPSSPKHLPFAITGKTETDWRSEPAAVVSDDWVVILVKRPPGKPRALIQHEELHKALVDLFTADRLIVFDGSIGAERARLLFMRAKLVVGVHGSGLANIMFMPDDAAVLEIRPRSLRNWRYHMLSEACSLKFFLAFADGSRDSPTNIKLPTIITATIEAARSVLPPSLLPPLTPPIKPSTLSLPQPKNPLPTPVTPTKAPPNAKDTAPLPHAKGTTLPHAKAPPLSTSHKAVLEPKLAVPNKVSGATTNPKVVASKKPMTGSVEETAKSAVVKPKEDLGAHAGAVTKAQIGVGKEVGKDAGEESAVAKGVVNDATREKLAASDAGGKDGVTEVVVERKEAEKDELAIKSQEAKGVKGIAKDETVETVVASDKGGRDGIAEVEVVKDGGKDELATKSQEDASGVKDAESTDSGAVKEAKEAPELVSDADSEELATTEAEPEGLVTETQPEEEGKEKR